MKYILYARKSTEEDDRQVLSIEAQLVELQEYAAKEKLEIVASLCEAKTAKEPGKTIGSNKVLGERRKEKFLITMSKNKLLAISLFFLLVPSFAFASSGGAALLLIFALIFIVVLVGLFVPVLAVYLLRKKSNPFLIAIDIIISVVLVLLIDIYIPIYDIFEMFNFLTTAFFVLVFILFISYYIAKRKGGEISAIKKVCFHGLATAILIIFLTTSYAFLAEPLYYKSGCSVNIIFNTYSDPTNNFNRLGECKYTSNNYTFCRVLGTAIKDMFCSSLIP